jgi:hypothetical protein
MGVVALSTRVSPDMVQVSTVPFEYVRTVVLLITSTRDTLLLVLTRTVPTSA